MNVLHSTDKFDVCGVRCILKATCKNKVGSLKLVIVSYVS